MSQKDDPNRFVGSVTARYPVTVGPPRHLDGQPCWIDHAAIEDAVVNVLRARFSDWRISEIEISEREAREIAADVTRLLRDRTAQPSR